MHFARLTFAAAACLLATAAAAVTRPTDAEISDLVAKYSAAAIADREDIHKNPELSNRETRTGALIAAHLKKLGIETRTGVAHTGVVGILKGGLAGRTIAVRADIDALPVTEVSDFPFNTLFTKAPSCITAADAPVVRPPHVQLLDYEIELGLVLRRDLAAGTKVGADDVGAWLAGVTIVNDLSARDIQLPQGQFYKGKSYRGFGPVGPGLVLLTPEEWARWPELHMRLGVNGQPRQDAYCREMIHAPAATLTELAAMHDVLAGDLIATGTPAGCAARAPGRLAMFVLRHLVSDATKWHLFIRKGVTNPAYLRPGDRLSLSIRTDDGAIDLGEQTTVITTG